MFQAGLITTAQLESQLVETGWQRQALHTFAWIATSVPFINSCHSVWGMMGALGQLVNPSMVFDSEQYNPSPWGPISAIIEHGLAGKHPKVPSTLSLRTLLCLTQPFSL